MDGKDIVSTVNTIVYLLPVLVLVWKSAKLTARFETLENTVKEKTDKFCKDHAEMKEKVEAEKNARLADNQILINSLNEISKSIVRIETKLDIEEKPKK